MMTPLTRYRIGRGYAATVFLNARHHSRMKRRRDLNVSRRVRLLLGARECDLGAMIYYYNRKEERAAWSSSCSRKAHDTTVLVRRAQLKTNRANL